MEANGMSVRLIALLQRLIGHMRGGLNVVMVIAMVLFSASRVRRWPMSRRWARC